MPHLILDFASPTAAQPGFDDICEHMAAVLRAQPAFPDPHAVKVRAMVWEQYCAGTSGGDFIHATLRLLPGRDAARKAQLSQTILQSLSRRYPKTNSVSVEIIEMDGASYSKELRDG